MALPKWPSSLPQCPLLNGSEYPGDDSNIIRTQFAGGNKSRRRFTRLPQPVMLSLVVNRAQMQVLHDFYFITLSQVLPFEWIEFRDPAKSPANYVFLKAPSFSPASSGKRWRAGLQLELRTPFNGTFPLTDELGTQLATDTDEGLTT